MQDEDKATTRPKRSLSKKKAVEKKSEVADRNQWTFLMKDDLVSVGDCGKEDSKLRVCQIRHPRRSDCCLYVLSSDNKTVHEVNAFQDTHRSWFVGNTVNSDGQLRITTPVDPIFLVLPYLINAGSSNRFMSLDQIVTDEELPDCGRLLSCSGLEQLCQVAEVKDVDEELKVYRYDVDKTLAWLKAKTDSAAEALKTKCVDISSGGSQSAMFVRSNKTDGPSKEDYIEFAFGIISDYLPMDLEASLKEHLGIKDKQPVSKENTTENEPPAKKAKTEDSVLEDYSLQYDLKKEKSKPKLTAAQKRLSKVDKTGMKNISSFFGKKS